MLTANRSHRLPLALLAGLTSAGAVAGAAQLIFGIAAPPTEQLPPGLSSWVLPGCWLLLSVGLPCGTTAVLAWRRSSHAPRSALVASGALGVELLVQLPFVGFNVLQPVFGLVAAVLALLAWDINRSRAAAIESPIARPPRSDGA